MYENLKLELLRSGISQKEIASYLGVHENTIGNKLSSGPFTIEEAFKLKEHFFPHIELKYLFRSTNRIA